MAKTRTKQPKPQRAVKHTTVEVPPTEQQIASGRAKPTRTGQYVVRKQVPIDFYRDQKRGGITLTQWEAANHLYGIFEKSGIHNLSTQAFWRTEGMPTAQGGGGDGLVYHHRQELYKAMTAISGSIGRLLVEKVVLWGEMVGNMDVPGYDAHGRMPRLREALDELVIHFDIYIPEEERAHYAHYQRPRRKSMITPEQLKAKSCVSAYPEKKQVQYVIKFTQPYSDPDYRRRIVGLLENFLEVWSKKHQHRYGIVPNTLKVTLDEAYKSNTITVLQGMTASFDSNLDAGTLSAIQQQAKKYFQGIA